MKTILENGKKEYDRPYLLPQTFAEEDVLSTSGNDNLVAGTEGADKEWGGIL